MKTRLFFTFFMLIAAFGLISSCQKESLAGLNSVDKLQVSLRSEGDCTIDCINEESGDLFSHQESRTVSWGGPNQNKFTKTSTLKVWNTTTEIVYQFTCTENISDLVVNGVSTGLNAPANSVLNYALPLPSGWAACDVMTNTFQLSGNGPPVMYSNIEYSLIGICPECDEEFTYVMNENGTYTFTYMSPEDQVDVNVVFTFAQGDPVSGMEGWTANGQTRQKVLSFNACEPVSWTVDLSVICNGNGQQNANVWTDFTIAGISKKGNLPNIVKPCN